MVVVIAAVAGVCGYQLLATSSPTVDVRSSPPSIGTPPGEGRVALGAADGAVPDRTTVFDDHVPAVANLDPALLRALRRAATDAHGLQLFVDSGWRSSAYQERLLEQAIAKYGSRAEATRWVA